jgi:CHASE1-domain containing sensor protein
VTEKRSSARWIPWAVLAVGVGLTLAVRRGTVERAHAEARASFDRLTDVVVATISDRLRLCEQVVRAATGLFIASETVTRAEWHHYVRQIGVDSVVPGLVGLEFVERIPRASVAEHLRRIRSEGLPLYRIWPDSAQDDAYPIVYGAAASYLELAGKLGASQILAKPFTGQEILAAITQVLGS